MAMSITFETLYELVRREKARDDLQELPKTFVVDVAKYVREKLGMLQGQQQSVDVFSISEKEKVESQVRNIRHLLSDLYDRRQKKVIFLAVNKAVTESALIDTSHLLEHEQKLYEEMVSTLSEYRNSILMTMLKGGEDFKIPEKKAENAPILKKEEKKRLETLRIVSFVPKFLGEKGEVYGPFMEDDIAHLPSKISEILRSKGKAALIGKQNS